MLGIVVCLAAGAACGFINGCVVVYGRIQPIIATLATGAIYIGLALILRPTPGGKVDEDLAWAVTNDAERVRRHLRAGSTTARPSGSSPSPGSRCR